MPINQEVLDYVNNNPGHSDREITDALYGADARQQPINKAAIGLFNDGLIVRRERADGRIGNYPAEGNADLVEGPATVAPETILIRDVEDGYVWWSKFRDDLQIKLCAGITVAGIVFRGGEGIQIPEWFEKWCKDNGIIITIHSPQTFDAANIALTEDNVKKLLEQWLTKNGWSTKIAMGHQHGSDIVASRSSGKWIIEVKGCGSLNPMRVNYFLAVLGEILQRMNDPDAKYSIAFPDMPQYRNLWGRLPALAKTRTMISALFVSASGTVDEIL